MSSIFNKPEDAVALTPVILMPLILFGGLFANSGGYPAWISWFQYISPPCYALEALIRNEFEDKQYSADSLNPIAYLGFNIGKGECLVIIAAMSIFLRILAFFCLKLLVTKFQ